MGDAARHSLYLVAESVYGTTPTSDTAFVNVRNTGCTLKTDKELSISDELRSDRQIPAGKHLTPMASGDINFEFSYGSFDTLLEAALMGTWNTNVLKAGTTRRSFSFLRHFADISDKPYQIFPGVEVNTFNLTVPANGKVTGSFSLMGGRSQVSLANLSGYGTATLGSPTTTEIFRSQTGSINEGGSSIGTITELSLSLTNNLQSRPVVLANPLQASAGRSSLSGTLTTYFQTAALLDKFLDETASDITFTLTDPAGNDYVFDLTNVLYGAFPHDVSGDGSVTAAIPFQGFYSGGSDLSNLIITRQPA